MGEQPAQQQPDRRPADRQAAAGRPVRRPRFGAWIGTGATAGVVVALLLAASTAPGGPYSRRQVALYLVLVLGSAGALLLGVAAAFLDARADRRSPEPDETTGPAEPATASGEPGERAETARQEQPEEPAPTDQAIRAEQAELRAEERSAGGRPPAP